MLNVPHEERIQMLRRLFSPSGRIASHMRRWLTSPLLRIPLGRQSIWVAFGCVLALILAAWYSHRALQRWDRTMDDIFQRRALHWTEIAQSYLTGAMRAPFSVFHTLHPSELATGLPPDLDQRLAAAFKRYPVVEELFIWRPTATSRGQSSPTLAVYARANRSPSWAPPDIALTGSSVISMQPASVGSRLIESIKKDAVEKRGFSCFDLEIDGTKYQIVALISYDDLNRDVQVAFGFLVNLDWAQQRYLSQLVHQLERRHRQVDLSFRILDDDRQIAAGTQPFGAIGVASRQLPLMFFDPDIAGSFPDRVFDVWTLEAGPTMTQDRKSVV